MSSRERGFSITPEKLALIEQKMREKGVESREALAKAANLSSDVIQKKLFSGRNVDRSTVEAVTRTLGIQPTDLIEVGEWYRSSKVKKLQASKNIDWQQICRTMLDRQIQFPTLNDLMAGHDVRIDPVNLFVPVGLIERKQRQYRRSDVDSAEQGSQLLQPVEEEIVQRFDTSEAFFDRVICNPDIPSGSRLVITGEPGSGKTTLLQKMGDRLLQAGMFPIWISLGKEGSSPTQTLVGRVLGKNIQPQDFSSSNWDESINALLQTGKVWLLLDGADELTVNRYPLRVIAEQLREVWANQVTVVLTCRLNCWDTDTLPKFTVFRTLEFDYHTSVEGFTNRVEAYIYKFFTKAEAEPQLADSLIQQLYSAGKERIRDFVRNPLRLSLLCYVWESGIGKLPDTKAELYKQFVDYYYELQERKHPELEGIDRTERDALNLALGEVAKAALNHENSRFRLRESLIESTPAMGKLDAKDSLFYKAMQLGWLNLIGSTTEKPYEAAYAFLHATFQEYFAALTIEDGTAFLPKEHDNDNPQPVGQTKYPIFHPEWVEVIAFWTGIKYLACNEGQSLVESFLLSLLKFRDGLPPNHWYEHRALFIAAKCISDHPTCTIADDILKRIIKLSFEGFDISSTGCIGNNCKRFRAIQALKEFNQAAISKNLEELIPQIANEDFMLSTTEEYIQETLLLIGNKISFANMVSDWEKSYVGGHNRTLHKDSLREYLDTPNEWEVVEGYSLDAIEIYENSIYRQQNLWQYADSMSYPDFYRIWHNSLSIDTELSAG